MDVALNYLEKLKIEIRELASTLYIGSYPLYSTLKKQGYRVLIVQRQLVFYKVDEENHRSISGKEWGDRRNCDLMLDSSIGVKETAEIICRYAERRKHKR